MGTGFSMDSNEYRAAAGAIEGYGAQQADHGSALAAGTSTPLSSSNTGIAGAISMIAQGTVQKIVTDVTSTTQGFANDTAKGLRTQADNADRLEADLVSRTNSVLNDPQGAVFGGGGSNFGSSGGLSGAGISGLTSYGGGVISASEIGNPLDTGAQLIEDSNGESAASASGAASGAGVIGEAESQESMSAMPLGQMRGAGAAGAGAGASEERGQRPGYLKSKPERTDDRAKKATAEHLKECGMAPISIGPDRLVCAKCGSIIELGGADAEALAA